MKALRYSSWLGGVLLAACPVLAVDLPEDIAGAPGSGRDPGFIVRTAQGYESDGQPLPPTFNRGVFQLNGTLRDELGVLIENEATPGPNPDGSFSVSVINFERDAIVEEPMEPIDGEEPLPTTNFQPNALFPGIPGENGHTTNFVAEVVTYLELAAGEYTFGGQVWVERTDVGGDDFFVVTAGTHPRDYLNLEVAEYIKVDAPAFSSVPNDFTYTVTVPQDGLYPFRLVFLQDVLGAALEWYSVDAATGDKILINDPDDARAIKAFQSSTSTNHNHPYIAEIRPQPGSKGIPASDKLEIVLEDDASLVDQGTLQIFHNELEITGEADIASANGRTTISYQPNPARVDLANAVRVVFQDTAGRDYERTWDFEISAGAGVTRVTGQWDFNGDLSATVGRDMEYLSEGLEARTMFSTTTALGIPDVNGEPAEVMVVPEAEGADTSIGYVMYHGIDPNGGGTRVNQYTLIADVMLFETGRSAAGIIQIDSPRPGADGVIPNSGDGDFFWQGNNMGQGGGGYVGDGSFTPFEWHRIVFAVDLAGDPRLVTKYVDGVKQDDWVQNSLDQPRRALLDEYAILFTDGDDGEQRGWYVNSVQIREGKMSDVEIELLGGPTAAGIPVSFFDDPNATISSRNVFGDLGGQRGKQERRLAVFNSGETQDLVIESVTPVGPEADFFQVVTFPETLASAEEGVIVVEFDPQGTTGLFEAALEVRSNDGGEALLTIDISARIDNGSGLVAHYQMDETEGDVMVDASGQRYHGTYGAAGTGSFALGQTGLATGQAVRFDDGGSPAAGGGGFGQLDAEASIPSLQNLTISMWVQPDAADAGASMLLAKGTAAGDPFALATNAVGDTNPLLWFVQEEPEIESDPVLVVGQPHHVVITQLDENGIELGSTRTRIYVDGELFTETEGGNGYEDLKPSVIQIGALNGGFGFTGIIDDVQIYSRELTAEEVSFLHANPGESVAEPDPPVVDPELAKDVTDPLDTILVFNGEDDGDGDAGAPPAAEGVSNAINDIGQKYLNFLDLGSGFTVVPRVGPTVVTGLRLYPANDVEERDPASYELWGSLIGPRADDFVLISSGDLALPSERNEGGNLAITTDLPHQEVSFENEVAYVAYRLIFPTLKDAGATNSMQIAEVEILGVESSGTGGDPRAEAVAQGGPYTEPTVVDFGELTGDSTFEFSFNAVKGGASTAIAGSELWGLKLDQWNEQGIFGTTNFGVADNVFTAVDGQSVASVFDQDVHVVFVSDTTANETRLYVNGAYVGRHDGALGLSGEANLMAARVASPVDAMGDGSIMYGWAAYDTALSEEAIAILADTPFDEREVPGDAPSITGVSRTAEGLALQLPDGVTYDVEYSTDLQTWAPIATDVTGTYTDTDAARASGNVGYYRAAVQSAR